MKNIEVIIKRVFTDKCNANSVKREIEALCSNCNIKKVTKQNLVQLSTLTALRDFYI